MVLPRLPTAYLSNPLLRYEIEIAGCGGMSSVQSELHRSPARKRFALWANSMGKTYAGAAEAWWHLLGRHPFRPITLNTGEGWLLSDDLQQGWKSACKALRQLEPPGVLALDCRYDEIRGYTWRNRKVLRTMRGTMLVAKGGSQSTQSTEGDKIDWLWVDEIPRRHHWNGCVSRVNRTYGPVWVTMTALTRASYLDVSWLRDKVAGSPDRGEPAQEGQYPDTPDGWHFFQRGMSRDRVPHLTGEQYQALINDVDPWERAQRVEARWEGITHGRWIPSFTIDNVFDEATFSAQDIHQIGIGVDYGEKPGNTIWYLAVCTLDRRVYMLSEWCPDERMSEADEVAGVVEHLLTPVGLSLSDVDIGRGDSNSAGRRGIALTVNELMMRHFAGMMPHNRAPFELRPPYKGPGSVRARARMINSACADRRFFVHSSCTRLQRTLRNWMGANDGLKHAFDAAGYIAEVWLAPGAGGYARHLVINR